MMVRSHRPPPLKPTCVSEAAAKGEDQRRAGRSFGDTAVGFLPFWGSPENSLFECLQFLLSHSNNLSFVSCLYRL